MADPARLLLGMEWFLRVAPDAFYEGEFEQILIENSHHLCPGYTAVPFKQTIESPEGRVQADIALIEAAYKSFIVVEVELGVHSFAGHVYPQARRLATGTYNSRHAAAICAKNATLDESKLCAMMKGEQPSIYIIVDQPKPDWEPDLRGIDVSLVAVEIYRSRQNHHAFRIVGDMPQSIREEQITACRVDPTSGFVTLASPAALIAEPHEPFVILFRGDITEWKILSTKDKMYLIPIRKSPLEPGQEYLIIRRNGTLEFAAKE